MSSLTNKSGFRILQFVGIDGRRKSMYLGKISAAGSKTIQGHIDRLLNAKIGGYSVERETGEWLGVIGDELHAKIVRSGLATAREVKQSHEISLYIDAYIKGRTDLKPRTISNLEQARETLVRFFGPCRDIATITRGEAGDWHRAVKLGYAAATVATHIKKARQIFADAIERKIITENPFGKLAVPSQVNASRNQYVPAADIADVIELCPDAEWALIFALARFGGLRTPSETHGLKWSDINWTNRIMTVRSPKTEHHDGKDYRSVPILPELMSHLKSACLATGKSAYVATGEVDMRVIERHRGENLRTMAEKLIKRAGLTPWPRLFQNLRASCETDLTAKFPLHVVCAWIGNSQLVAARHYLSVTDEHFAQATGKALQNTQQSPTEMTGQCRTKNAETPPNSGVSAEKVPLRGVELPQEIAAQLRLSEKALQKALQRLEEAAPHILAYEIQKLQDAVAAARGVAWHRGAWRYAEMEVA